MLHVCHNLCSKSLFISFVPEESFSVSAQIISYTSCTKVLFILCNKSAITNKRTHAVQEWNPRQVATSGRRWFYKGWHNNDGVGKSRKPINRIRSSSTPAKDILKTCKKGQMHMNNFNFIRNWINVKLNICKSL